MCHSHCLEETVLKEAKEKERIGLILWDPCNGIANDPELDELVRCVFFFSMQASCRVHHLLGF